MFGKLDRSASFSCTWFWHNQMAQMDTVRFRNFSLEMAQ
jgi:hypothetical protein